MKYNLSNTSITNYIKQLWGTIHKLQLDPSKVTFEGVIEVKNMFPKSTEFISTITQSHKDKTSNFFILYVNPNDCGLYTDRNKDIRHFKKKNPSRITFWDDTGNLIRKTSVL